MAREQLGDLEGVLEDLFPGLRPVREAAGVTEVDEVLVGQEVDQGPDDGEPAEPAVEHPDRPAVHGQPT